MKVAIIGAGKLGITITEALLSGDNEVTLVDKNNDLMQKINSQLDLLTVTANAKQVSFMEELKIWTYDYLVAVTDNDEKNMVICSFAKHLGCPKVIARIRDPEHVTQIQMIKEALNIDFIVNPDMSISNEIYKYLVEKYTLNNGCYSSGKIAVIEFSTDKIPVLIDKPIHNVTKILGDMQVTAISRNGKVIIPRGDTVILNGDRLYVLGLNEHIQKLNDIVHDKNQYTDLQRVMIAGGGKSGFYLAQKLSNFGVAVKIIEIDKARCQYLSEHLHNVMVLHGDATDPNLLEEENINEMDAFVTVTGFDEENLLLALMAKQHDIEDVVAKVSRKSYADLIEKMGISMALNPLDMSATNILRYIQGSTHIIFSQLIQGQAEFIELVADQKMRLLNQPLKNLELPNGVIIAAIHRGEEAIIPNGDTVIKNGDRIIILSLLSNIPYLEKLFRSKRSRFFK